MTFAPTPQLAHATHQALSTFARHRPQLGTFRTFLAGGDEASRILADWARALLGVSLEVIPEAASRWTAERTEIPSPAAFATYARTIDEREYRSRDRLDGPPPLVLPRKPPRIDVLSRRAHEQLHDWDAVQEVWRYLVERTTTDAELQSVRDGHVSDAAFAAAVHAVLNMRDRAAVVA